MTSDAPPPLLFGPYPPPDASDGWLFDWRLGLIEVGGWTDAPITWPRRKKTGRASPILCGSLVIAVRAESSAAVQYWWGVSAGTVWAWRKALDVDRVTPGTRARLQTQTGVPAEASARGREAAASPEARAKLSEARRGKPAHPNTRAALLKAAKAAKPEGWGKRANRWMQEAKQDDPDPA